MEKSIKVGLFGTCNGSTWREELISLLEKNNIDYFNPVVDVWDDEARRKEEYEKDNCDFCLFVITSKMEGVFSIAEVVDRVHLCPFRTIFTVLEDGFSENQIKSLRATQELIQRLGGYCFNNLEKTVNFLNKMNEFS